MISCNLLTDNNLDSVMRRKIYEQLLLWKAKRKGRSAMMIEGARRVGKSYIVKEFAQREYKSYNVVWVSACKIKQKIPTSKIKA